MASHMVTTIERLKCLVHGCNVYAKCVTASWHLTQTGKFAAMAATLHLDGKRKFATAFVRRC